MNEGRLILQGARDQAGYTAKLIRALVDSTPFGITLVFLKGTKQYKANGTAFVRCFSRDPQLMTVGVDIELIDIDPNAPLSTTWNAVEAGSPRLFFRASFQPGNRPEHWEFVEQTSGPDFFWMGSR